MKVKALRGVCIGVGRHMGVGDVEDLEPALVTFLVGIGAVERVPDPPPEPIKAVEPQKVEALTPPVKSAPEKSGGKEK